MRDKDARNVHAARQPVAADDFAVIAAASIIQFNPKGGEVVASSGNGDVRPDSIDGCFVDDHSSPDRRHADGIGT